MNNQIESEPGTLQNQPQNLAELESLVKQEVGLPTTEILFNSLAGYKAPIGTGQLSDPRGYQEEREKRLKVVSVDQGAIRQINSYIQAQANELERSGNSTMTNQANQLRGKRLELDDDGRVTVIIKG